MIIPAKEQTSAAVAQHYDERSLIEIVLLVNQYDGLAATIAALRIQRDSV